MDEAFRLFRVATQSAATDPRTGKIDMDLIRNVDTNRARQAIVRNLVRLCEDMGIQVVAEGIETPAERDFLFDAGIRLMQGYLFAKPALAALPAVSSLGGWPAAEAAPPRAA